MRTKLTLILLALGLLLLPAQSQAASKSKKAKKANKARVSAAVKPRAKVALSPAPAKPFNAVLAFVPGAAQFNRGSNGKGSFFIAGLAASAAGVAVFSAARTDADQKFRHALYSEDAKTHYNAFVQNDQYFMASVVAASSFYLANVFDAFGRSQDGSKTQANSHFPTLVWGLDPERGQKLQFDWKI